MCSEPRWSRLALLVSAILFAGGALAPAFADDRAAEEGYGSVYGRVRHLEGGLTVLREGEGTVTEGTVNDPVAPGDRLTTEDGRAEISLADGSVVWLDRGTILDVRNLSDINNRYEKTNLFALERGAIRIDTSDPDAEDRTFRIDTEAGSVYLLSGGSFRIEHEDSATTVYSFRGVAELSGDEDSVLVRTGERGSVQPGHLPSDPRRFNTARLDDFDRFVDVRQEAFLRNEGDLPPQEMAEEVPDEVQPYVSELSYYGAWHRVPAYGWVWRPVYYGGWGPYVNGYWSWCRGGWVWVSYDPWGWAPYHYGRWDYTVDIGWVWIPGRVWSGAWVSFGVGPSYVGWCPLNYYNRPVFHDVTIINVVNVNATRLEPRGWRFVSVEQFADRRGSRNYVRADRLPKGTDLVITSRLPRFEPKDVARRPEHGARLVETVRKNRTPLPAAVGRDNRPVSFRNLEKVAEPRSRRGGPPPRSQDRPRTPGGQSADRPGRPRQDARTPAPGPDTKVRPPRENARPQGSARPRDGAPSQDRPSGSSGSQGQAGRETQRPPAGKVERPRREPPRSDVQRPNVGRTGAARPGSGRTEAGRTVQRRPDATTKRPGDRSDQAVGRLFDGARGDRGHTRVEPQRVQPPGAQPHRVGAPPQGRQGAASPTPKARRPDQRPPAPPRPPQKQEKEKDNGSGSRD